MLKTRRPFPQRYQNSTANCQRAIEQIEEQIVLSVAHLRHERLTTAQ